MRTDEWLTPPEIIKSLGEFDLDPCSPIVRPWNTAKQHYTTQDNGLSMVWTGRVWLNPPYGKEADTWLGKLADHNNGIALTFARTETVSFFKQVWRRAHAVLFIEGRIYFYDVTGNRAAANAGAPSVLIAYGDDNVQALKMCAVPGKYICLK